MKYTISELLNINEPMNPCFSPRRSDVTKMKTKIAARDGSIDVTINTNDVYYTSAVAHLAADEMRDN